MSAYSYGARLRQLREIAKISQDTAANATGVSKSTWIRYEKGEQEAPLNVLLNYYKYLRHNHGIIFDFNWIAWGQGSPFTDGNQSTSEYIQIPLVNVILSAGAGNFIENEQVVSHLAFRRDWLHTVGGPQGKYILQVTGDSMAPTIQPRDTVLIDSREEIRKNPAPGEIYAVRIADVAVIKRVHLMLGDNDVWDRITLQSDNPDRSKYPDIEIRLIPDMENPILGKVIWIAREIG